MDMIVLYRVYGDLHITEEVMFGIGYREPGFHILEQHLRRYLARLEDGLR